MKAFLKNYRQSPRKVRLVADLIKGKSVEHAMLELDILPKRASTPIRKLISSALANAKNSGLVTDGLVIKELTVDKGIVLKRMRARAMGRGAGILKRTSHINVMLGEKVLKNKKASKLEKVKEEANKEKIKKEHKDKKLKISKKE